MIPDKLEWLFQEYENSWTKEKKQLNLCNIAETAIRSKKEIQ